MIELTPSARQRLDAYLSELRRVLLDCPSVDPADVERDVQDHIDAALSDSTGPVDAPHLDEVLKSLGEPREWAPDREAWFRRHPAEWWAEAQEAAKTFTHRLAAGPESYRLPYLSLLVLALSWIIVPIADDHDAIAAGFIGTLAAFVLARAALALHVTERPSASQMWLLGPSLLLIYAPLLTGLLTWTVAAGAIAVDEAYSMQSARQRVAQRELEQHEEYLSFLLSRRDKLAGNGESGRLDREQNEREIPWAQEAAAEARKRAEVAGEPETWMGRPLTPTFFAVAAVGFTGLWWLLLGQLAWWKPGFVRRVFRPFADHYRGWSGLALSLAGVVLLCGGLLFLV
jgi:hypothetical protein